MAENIVSQIEDVNNTPVHPHVDNMGVEIIQGVSWHVDYFTVTVHGCTVADVKDFWLLWLKDYFGDLIDQGHGGRFYKRTFRGALGTVVRAEPTTGGDYCTFEFPGQSCVALGLLGLSEVYHYLKFVFRRVVVRRIDIAFDGVPFTVQDVYSALIQDAVRSDFKRDTLLYIENPRQARENGVLGCSTVAIGSRTSTRYMRVYDKHGETRLEIEYKDEKSIQVAETILEKNQDDALKAAVGHMRDYIDFLTDWWDEFVKEYERLYAKLPASVREIELKRVTGWLIKQVSSALSVGYEAHGEEFIRSMIEFGRHKREDNPRYRSVLSLLSSGRKTTN